MADIVPVKTWAIGGSPKCGYVSAAVTSVLAHAGERVALIDATSEGPKIHDLLGINCPESGTAAALPLEDLILVCDSSTLIDQDTPEHERARTLFYALSGLGAEYVVICLGAGFDETTLDLFNLADLGIIVSGSESVGIRGAYRFLTLATNSMLLNMFSDAHFIQGAVSSLLEGDEKAETLKELVEKVRDIDKEASQRITDAISRDRYRIVTVAEEENGKEIAASITETAQRFLQINPRHSGSLFPLPEGDDLAQALTDKEKSTIKTASGITKHLLRQHYDLRSRLSGVLGKPPSAVPFNAAGMQLGYNNEVQYNGKVFHVQTEDLGQASAKIVTTVYCDGHIVLSKTTEYADLKISGDIITTVNERVKWQHRVIMAGISSGKLKNRISLRDNPPAPTGP